MVAQTPSPDEKPSMSTMADNLTAQSEKVLEYGEARLALLNSDDPGIDADRFVINRYDLHQGKIIDQPRGASLPCKRAGVPCVAVNTNAKDAESKGPTVEKTQDGELIAETSKKSKESFNCLLEEYNFSSVAKQDKLYTKLSTRLPEFTAPRVDRIAGFTNKIARGALAVAGLALYGKAVADVFSSDASVLDKAGHRGIHPARNWLRRIARRRRVRHATYQILTLFQASQLTGDLHAAHRVLSENATISAAAQQDQGNADVGAHVRPELKRQICATIAEAKHQLHVKLEGIALNYTVKLGREFKKQFLDEWFGHLPCAHLGRDYPRIAPCYKTLQEQVNKARNTPLPLYEEQVKAAVKEAMERLAAPAPCQCEQGRKKGKCEFGDCQGPKLEGHPRDAGGRVYITDVPSLEMARRVSISESCQAVFTTSHGPGSAGETGRPLWCTPG
ncbi:uncharacterized protein G6M90_00g108900 [Metarhizium brunneum]|uniref:Uncharacterized protein n=1 Tax=Metarhizium brunneum TaxID=500148 RepID=A0A7D5V5J0_9HYPO|nr:hypothetical protein G6M90_00g108900 [Metarhizium brunneum]